MESKNRKLLFFVFTAIIFFLFKTPVSSANDASIWQELGIYGGQITSIEVHPLDPSVIYAGSWMGDGLFKSTDYGKRWETIGWFRNYEVFDIAIDPNNPSTIWVANNRYLDVSYDGGKTFRSFTMPDRRFCYSVAVDPHDPSGETVYAGLGGENNTDYGGIIYVTRDGGETWFDEGLTALFNVRDLKINPNRKGEIWFVSNEYQISDNGVIYSRPGEYQEWESWTANYYIGNIIIHPVYHDLVFTGGQYGILYKKDGPLPTDFEWSVYGDSYFARSLCIPPSDPQVIYSGFVDGGNTIIAANHNFGESGYWYDIGDAPDEFICMTADPENDSILYAGGINSGVFKSESYAVTWSTSNNGIKANTVYSTDISGGETNSIVCGTVAGVFLSDDGSQWNKINRRSSYFVLFCPDSRNTIYAGQTWDIAKTTDSGSSWSYKKVSERSDSHNVYSIAIDAKDSNIIYAGLAFRSGNARGEVIKLIDNGESFYYASKSTLLETPAPVNTIVTNKHRPETILVGTGSFFAPVVEGEILKSTDSGETWKTVLSGVTVNALTVDTKNPDTLYAVCGASDTRYFGIYKSLDGGENWELIINGLPDKFTVTDLKVDPDNSDILYASLYRGISDDFIDDLNGVYVSLDGGNYWSQIGLSDYRLHDINANINVGANYNSQAVSFKGSDIPLPKSTIITGTASGLYRTNAAGTGLIHGNIVSQDTGEPVDGALISSTLGSNTISDRGMFLMLAAAGVHSLNIQSTEYMGTHIPSVTVQAGGQVYLEITLYPANSNNGNCLFSKMLNGATHNQNFEFFREFRDSYLKKTSYGRQIVSFYYDNGKDLFSVMQKNPALLRYGIRLLFESIPVFGKLLIDNSCSVPVSFWNKTDGFLFNLEQQSSDDELKKRIYRIRKGLKDSKKENDK